MSIDMNFLSLFWQASPLVKGVMLFLLTFSVISWSVIFRRHTELKQANHKYKTFEDHFWTSPKPKTLFEALDARRGELGGLEHIFYSGYKEFYSGNATIEGKQARLQRANKAMRVALSRETDKLEQNLPFLATVGSISPYIGLFGTVWGIMQSFIALGNVQQATIAMVAPGIAEALIATAMGLFAAIPAVIAYNRFSTRVDTLVNQYDNFLDELSNVLSKEEPSTV